MKIVLISLVASCLGASVLAQQSVPVFANRNESVIYYATHQWLQKILIKGSVLQPMKPGLIAWKLYWQRCAVVLLCVHKKPPCRLLPSIGQY
jgi:hypothetical protein